MFRSIRLSVVPAMISAMCPAITRILQESHRKMLPLPAAFFLLFAAATLSAEPLDTRLDPQWKLVSDRNGVQVFVRHYTSLVRHPAAGSAV